MLHPLGSAVKAHHLGLALGVCFWLGPAGVAAQTTVTETAPPDRVLLWPPSSAGVDPAQVERVSAALRTQLDGLVGARLIVGDVQAARQSPELSSYLACIEEVRCLASLGHALQARWVLTGAVRAGTDSLGMELRMVDSEEQREVGRAFGRLPGRDAELAVTLRELAVRLVAPENYLGTLVINGLEVGQDARIDNNPLVITQSGVAVRVPLGVGKHSVEIKQGNQRLLTEVVDIRFEEIMVLTVPEAGKVAAAQAVQAQVKTTAESTDRWSGDVVQHEQPLRLPLWVAPIPLVALVPAALLGAVAVLDLAFIGPLALGNPSQCEPTLAANETNGFPNRNPKANPGNVCGSLWAYGAREETRMAPVLALDLVVMAAGALLGLGAVATSAILLALGLVPMGGEDADSAVGGKPAVTRKQAVRAP